MKNHDDGMKMKGKTVEKRWKINNIISLIWNESSLDKYVVFPMGYKLVSMQNVPGLRLIFHNMKVNLPRRDCRWDSVDVEGEVVVVGRDE